MTLIATSLYEHKLGIQDTQWLDLDYGIHFMSETRFFFYIFMKAKHL